MCCDLKPTSCIVEPVTDMEINNFLALVNINELLRVRKQLYFMTIREAYRKDLALQYKKGKATIDRGINVIITSKIKNYSNRRYPVVLGIDEHFFSKRQGFATTFFDLRKHKVFDVVPGRSEPALRDYLQQPPGKERVQVICMDLSSTSFFNQKVFPKC